MHGTHEQPVADLGKSQIQRFKQVRKRLIGGAHDNVLVSAASW
jgi:hypothetical protein